MESLEGVDLEKTRVFCSRRSHYASLGLHVSDVSHLPSACLSLIEVGVTLLCNRKAIGSAGRSGISVIALSKQCSVDLKTVHFYVVSVESEEVDKEVYSVGNRGERSTNHREVGMKSRIEEQKGRWIGHSRSRVVFIVLSSSVS